MKFSCDSCGAQYLIADEKIGPKGVKVRCKKCSHVIILRPAGWKPTPKKPVSVPPPPPPVDSPLVPPVSSDMGVSQEFAALGFDDKPSRAAVRPATLSVGLDVDAAPAPRAETSPFQSTQRSGGSLDEVLTPKTPSSPPSNGSNGSNGNGFHGEMDVATALGSSVPASASDDEEPATRVDALDSLPQEDEPTEDKKDPLTAVEDLSALAALERAHSLQAKAEADAAADADAFPAFGEVQTETAPAEEDSVPAPVVTAGPEPEPFAAPGGADMDDPLADMKSSLDDELGAQFGGLGGLDDGPGFDANPKTDVSSRPEVVAAREAETMEQPVPKIEAAPATVEDPLQTQVDDDDDADGVASELGSAFDQMFGEGGNELDDLAAELGATREPEANEDENRQETRIFDSDAIGQVEAEQRIADDEAEKPAEEWFVAISDEQVGPLGPDAILEHWEAGRLTAESLCWKQGMGDWVPMSEVEAFNDLPEQEAPEPPEEESVPLGPPTLATRSQTEPAATEVAAASAEPAWRPSAASALASLAAEELAAPIADPAASIAPVAAASPIASQIPPAADALEKLLGGDPPSETARFGAAEQSESLVRPLPRRADTVSSMPLRDPVPSRRGGGGNNWVVPAAILGGFLLLGLFVLGGIYLLRDEPEGPKEVAKVEPPATPVAPPAKLAPPPAADQAALAALAAPSGTSGPSGASGVPAPSGVSGPSGDVVGKAVTAPPETEPEEVKKAPPPKKKRTRRTRRTTKRAPPPEPPPPPPPPPRRASRDTTDDLLNPTSSKRRPTSAEPPPSLPRKLDDSDVLGVLRKNRRDITRCRDKQTSADPSLEGTMTVDFVILKSGRPKRVGVSPSKFRKSVVGKCVVSAVKKWRFPKFSGASMPLDFPVTIRGR